MSYKEDSSISLPCQSIPVDVGAPEGAFPGFRAPSYTMVPDELFDQLLPDLSGAALKVLLYIVRRTFGFKKQCDNISLSQLCCGITTRDGRALDRGTGLSRSTVILALKELTGRNIIIAARHGNDKHGNEATTYQLHMASTTPAGDPPPGPKIGLPPWAENRPTPSPKIGLPLVRKSAPQQTGEQKTDIDIESMPPTPADAFAQDEQALQKSEDPQSPVRQKKGRSAPGTRAPALSVPAHLSPAPAAMPCPPSTEHTLQQATQVDAVAEALAGPLGALARELGDEAAPGASLTRACNLFHTAGVSLPAFLSRLHEAGARTRAYQTTIMGRGRDGQAPRGMPYLFAVLARLPDPEPALVPAPPTRSWRRPRGAVPARAADTHRYTGGSYGVCEHCLSSPCEADCPARIHDTPAADAPLTPQLGAIRAPVMLGSNYAHSS